uniref:Uncharacterized protein n=1 Tax=Timema poppense TaxID=170557 RepID=A0A7R9D8B9_TIMPO|nr:unnamed protein product [Timema poppensis]
MTTPVRTVPHCTGKDKSSREHSSTLLRSVTEQASVERECPVTQKVAMLNKIPILTKTCPSPSPGVLTPPRFVFGSVLSSSRLDAPPATPPSGSTSPSSSIDGSTAPMTPSKPLLLRPSQLALGSTSAANSSSFSLLTTGLSNPLKLPGSVQSLKDLEFNLSQVKAWKVLECSVSKNNEYSSENSVFKEGCFPVLESLKTNPIQVMPKFVPLGTPSKQREDSATTAISITTTTPPRSFVFGQNLHERIAGRVQIDVRLSTWEKGRGELFQHGQQRASNPGSVERGFCGGVHFGFIVDESERVNWGWLDE